MPPALRNAFALIVSLPKSDRKYFPPFSLCGYSFSLLADPGGNPRAANQALAVGAARVEKGLSVYLTVAFQDDLPDTPPWGGGESAFDQPFPPPPLQFGPGHPWGANRMELDSDSDNDETDSQESERDLESGRGIDRLSSASFARIVNSNATLVPAKKHSGAGRASPEMVRRDPHGLRRRRRRCRRREGRIKGVSHDGDPATVARECCASFSLAAMNKTGRRDFMWASSMEGDRFYPGRNSWGVHCLLPTSVIQACALGSYFWGSLSVIESVKGGQTTRSLYREVIPSVQMTSTSLSPSSRLFAKESIFEGNWNLAGGWLVLSVFSYHPLCVPRVCGARSHNSREGMGLLLMDVHATLSDSLPQSDPLLSKAVASCQPRRRP